MEPKYKVQSLEITCYACPTQWEGKTADGYDIYIRYRWGNLTLDINGQTVATIEGHGDGFAGVLEHETMKELLKDYLEF